MTVFAAVGAHGAHQQPADELGFAAAVLLVKGS